jgi:hypothetical protein
MNRLNLLYFAEGVTPENPDETLKKMLELVDDISVLDINAKTSDTINGLKEDPREKKKWFIKARSEARRMIEEMLKESTFVIIKKNDNENYGKFVEDKAKELGKIVFKDPEEAIEWTLKQLKKN